MPTTAELIAFTRDLLAEESEDYYDDETEVLPLINDGKRKMFTRLDVLPRTSTLNLTADTYAYDLDVLVARFESVTYNDTTELIPAHFHEFIRMQQGLPQTGSPRYYCPDYLKNDGTQQIAFYPTPAISESGAIDMFYFAEPADLVSGASPVNPTWHTQFHMVPCYYAAAMLMRKDRLDDRSEQMEQRFYLGIEEYRRWYERKFPYRNDSQRQVPSRLREIMPATQAYPYELG